MNSIMPMGLRKSLPARAIPTIQLVLLATVLISPLIVAPVFALPKPTTHPALAQDEGLMGQWITMKPTGARASFEMPSKPRYVERSFSPLLGKPPIKVRLHLSTVADGNLSYVFSYHDLHEIPKDGETTKAALEGAVRGSVANVLGHLVDIQDLGWKTNPMVVRQDKYIGRQFACRFIHSEKRFIVTSRVFLVGKRLYQLNCIMAEDIFDMNLPAKFLKSFKIIVPEDDSPPRPRLAN